jgi:hypothetical protein
MINKNLIKGIGKTKNNVLIQLITENHYNSNRVKKLVYWLRASDDHRGHLVSVS